MTSGEVIKIDIGKVLGERVPGIARFIPGWLIHRIEKLICQKELNELLEENAGLTGAGFCRGVLRSLNVKVDVRFAERLPAKDARRVVLVSNHPLGGLDGLALIDIVQRHFGGQVWFIVNDLLMAVKPLEDVFVPINKHGSQSRKAIARIDEVFAGNDPVLIFPAGLVSRYHKVDLGGSVKKTVCDLDWHKMFVTKSIQHKRDIVPLFFNGFNSMDFYMKANLRKRLGLKFNFEQVLLPREVVRSRGKHFTVTVGNTRHYADIEFCDAVECSRSIYREVYAMMLDIDPDTGSKKYIKSHALK